MNKVALAAIAIGLSAGGAAAQQDLAPLEVACSAFNEMGASEQQIAVSNALMSRDAAATDQMAAAQVPTSPVAGAAGGQTAVQQPEGANAGVNAEGDAEATTAALEACAANPELTLGAALEGFEAN